jgi:Acyl dehydratase
MKYKIGDKFDKCFNITENLVKDFCSVTGDLNPIHLDEQFAKKTSFKNRIAPGLLLGSLIASVIGNDFPGSGTIYLSQTFKFISPAYLDEIISIQIEIIEIKRNNWIVLKTQCINQDKKIVLFGEAIVMVNDNNEVFTI